MIGALAPSIEPEVVMAVKLHRCPSQWAKFKSHPCWKVQKALDEQGIAYEVVPGPWAIEFEDGSWYREQSADMERTIREGRLDEKRGSSPAI
jgi:hypothetical protein